MSEGMPKPVPSVSDGFKGLIFAALISPLVLLIRLPLDAYFSGLGLLRWLEALPIRILLASFATFAVLTGLGFPIWLLYRRASRQPRFWHFAAVGTAVGTLLASRVSPASYGSPDFPYPWARGGQQTVRTALDGMSLVLNALLPCLAFWYVVHGRRLRRRGENE
jgi:hypothetical protein